MLQHCRSSIFVVFLVSFLCQSTSYRQHQVTDSKASNEESARRWAPALGRQAKAAGPLYGDFGAEPSETVPETADAASFDYKNFPPLMAPPLPQTKEEKVAERRQRMRRTSAEFLSDPSKSFLEDDPALMKQYLERNRPVLPFKPAGMPKAKRSQTVSEDDITERLQYITGEGDISEEVFPVFPSMLGSHASLDAQYQGKGRKRRALDRVKKMVTGYKERRARAAEEEAAWLAANPGKRRKYSRMYTKAISLTVPRATMPLYARLDSVSDELDEMALRKAQMKSAKRVAKRQAERQVEHFDVNRSVAK